MTEVTGIVLATALAFIAESMTEYIFSTPIEALKKIVPGLEEARPLKYIALLVGVGLSFAYSLDLFALAFPQAAAVQPWVGILLTGLGIGRGSNYIHDLWTRYLRPQSEGDNE